MRLCLHARVIDTVFCSVGPWVWLYYANEIRKFFGDTPALDVVKMYDVRMFW